ncbi:MAG: hypothetical protein M4579_004852 [Chaenotheca gracillima]|nr:MAG: hypothetical protein M4579_004852 [Chaenotheca gracillima]
MRLRLYNNDTVSLLTRIGTRRRVKRWTQWRGFAATAAAPLPGPPQEIAIVGGGISGLAATHYLAEQYPDVPIHLYESSSRLGGWVESKRVQVGAGTVVFEQGPRNLRPNAPNGLVTLDLVDRLGIADQVLAIPKTSPAAKNRYIFYPDHLARLPGSLAEFLVKGLTEPVLKGFITGVLREPFNPGRPEGVEDESVADFISRRLSPDVAENMVSAVFHGIYAGDIHQLSASSLLSQFYHVEGKYGSIIRGWLADSKKASPGVLTDANKRVSDEMMRKKVPEKFNVQDMSVFTFKGGIETLVKALEKDARRRPNVQINLNSSVKLSGPSEPSTKAVRVTASAEDRNYSHVVCTAPGPQLQNILEVPTDSFTSAPTVMVVNFHYANPDILPVQGFGYLLPQSVPLEQNYERALGVVFDSVGTGAQDTVPGTKLTVMLGGHWWDDWAELPSHEECIDMAKSVLARHLGIHEQPDAVNATLQKKCIPQYLVGYQKKLDQMETQMSRTYSGRVKLMGSSFGGVALNDCVRSARDLVDMIEGPTSLVRQIHEWS